MPYRFIPARNYTKGRTDQIELLVVHAMEAPEGHETAEDVARWFAGPDAPRGERPLLHR